MTPTTTCHICGGDVRPVTGPGRVRSYKGISGFEIPADLAIPTCSTCGRCWVTAEHLRAMDEPEFQRRLARV